MYPPNHVGWYRQTLLMEGDAYAWFLRHHVVVVHQQVGWCGYTTINRDTGVVFAEAGGRGYRLEYMKGYVDGLGLIYRIEDEEKRGQYVGGRGRVPTGRGTRARP